MPLADALIPLLSAATPAQGPNVTVNGDNLETLFGIVGLISIIAIFVFASVAKTFARERTRREIAAYIAEGSLTQEQGTQLIKARVSD